MASNTISILIQAKDQASKVLKGVASDFDKTAAASKKVAKGVMIAGAAVAAGIGASIKVAADFETQMGNIATLTGGTATDSFNTLGKSILDMTKRVPKSAEDLGASAYDILSAGVQGTANQLHVLENSAKLATAGLSTTKEATNIMTSALNAFKIPAADAHKVSDILFKTVKNGKTTIAEMAQAFGASAPVIASAGISLEEFSAATAALTLTGLPASQAQQQLRQSVVSLQKPTKEMSELIKEAGYESGVAALKQDGLQGAMKRISAAAGGNQEELAKAYGSVEAFGAATSLTGNQADAFNATLKDMTTGADAVGNAFETQAATTSSAWTMLKNNAIAVGITVGSVLLPPLANFVRVLAENLEPALMRTASFLEQNRIVLAILAGMILAAVVPAFVAWSISAGAAAIATMAALAPILLIGAAVGAFAYLVISNWDSIRESTTKIFKVIFGFIGEKLTWLKENWASAIGFMIGFFATLPIKLPILIGRAILAVVNFIRNIDWGKVWTVISDAFSGAVSGMWKAMKGLFNKVTGMDWGQIFKNAAKGIGNSIVGLLEGAINGALSGIPGAPKVSIPRFEKGVRNFGGGMAVVGERGAELVRLPKGSDVYSNRESRQMMSDNAPPVQQTFNVKVFNQFDLKQAMREAGYMLAR